jgi:uncharacterized protein YegL
MKITIPKNIEAKNKPTNYFFVTDLSGSMWGSIQDLKQTIKAAKELLKPNDTFSLAYFSSSGDFDWICKGSSVNSDLKSLIENKIYARGLTCFTEVLQSLDGVVKDVEMISANTDNVLFFLTDGYPNNNSPESEVIRLSTQLKNKFVHKQIVGYSNYYNRNLLLEMAEKMAGSFSHVNDYSDMKKTCHDFVSSKKSVKVIDLPKCYDLIWQVSDTDINVLECSSKKVEVLESDVDAELFAIDYSELDSLSQETIQDAKFCYSLAFVLSQKNKANLGVSLLRKAGALAKAKMLQKSFTTSQKGKAENELKSVCLLGGTVAQELKSDTVTLNSFLDTVKQKIGEVYIDLDSCSYRAISRKGADASKVEFKTTDRKAKIVSITGNENRANISFLTVRNGQVSQILDEDLKTRVEQHNQTCGDSQKIQLPISAETYRNYTFVANGDFNFDKLVLESQEQVYNINPEKDIDIFDENQKDISISEFVKLYKSLIEEKAHASVLRYYVKQNSTQKHTEDKRVDKYGADGAKLLEEMGFDYQMRYSPKKEYKSVETDADYIPFLEITGQLKGAATISASKSYEKFVKKGKPNVGDAVVFPLFEKYDKKFNDLGKSVFVEFCQKTLDGIEETVDLLSQKISASKFYLMATNSWFIGVEKSDEFEYDGLVVKTKETKEYI